MPEAIEKANGTSTIFQKKEPDWCGVTLKVIDKSSSPSWCMAFKTFLACSSDASVFPVLYCLNKDGLILAFFAILDTLTSGNSWKIFLD